MPRALVMQATQATPHERAGVTQRLRRTRDGVKAAGANYWVFEDPGFPGQFIEFFEGRDAETVRTARQAVGAQSHDDTVLLEVEL